MIVLAIDPGSFHLAQVRLKGKNTCEMRRRLAARPPVQVPARVDLLAVEMPVRHGGTAGDCAALRGGLMRAARLWPEVRDPFVVDRRRSGDVVRLVCGDCAHPDTSHDASGRCLDCGGNERHALAPEGVDR